MPDIRPAVLTVVQLDDENAFLIRGDEGLELDGKPFPWAITEWSLLWEDGLAVVRVDIPVRLRIVPPPEEGK